MLSGGRRDASAPERAKLTRFVLQLQFLTCRHAGPIGGVFHESSRVRFHPLAIRGPSRTISRKWGPASTRPGAYAAHGSGAEIIAKIDGSFTNVVGLPMEKTVAALAKFGISSEVGLTNRVKHRHALDQVFAIIGPESDRFCLQICVALRMKSTVLLLCAHEDRMR